VDKLIVWHNVLMLKRQAEYWNTIAKKSTRNEYTNWIELALKQDAIKNIKMPIIKEALNYIDTAIEEGIKKANYKFKHHFESNKKRLSHASFIKKKTKGDKNSVEPQISITKDVLPNYII